MTRRFRITNRLTRASGGSMLFYMLRRHPGIRVTIALLAAFVIFVSAPLHAAHNHGDTSDPSRIHAPCAICQMQTPACGPLWEPGPDIPLDPVFVLTIVTSPRPISAPAVVNGCRAPPFVVA